MRTRTRGMSKMDPVPYRTSHGPGRRRRECAAGRKRFQVSVMRDSEEALAAKNAERNVRSLILTLRKFNGGQIRRRGEERRLRAVEGRRKEHRCERFVRAA